MALVVGDIVAVADRYCASNLGGATVVNSKNEKIGELDDPLPAATEAHVKTHPGFNNR